MQLCESAKCSQLTLKTLIFPFFIYLQLKLLVVIIVAVINYLHGGQAGRRRRARMGPEQGSGPAYTPESHPRLSTLPRLGEQGTHMLEYHRCEDPDLELCSRPFFLQ